MFTNKSFCRLLFGLLLFMIVSFPGCAVAAANEQSFTAMQWFKEGHAYEDKNDYSKAIYAYNKTIELNPKYEKAYNNRGFCYYSKGQYDLAINDFNKLVELNPQHVKAYEDEGTVLLSYFLEKNLLLLDGSKL